MTYLVLLVVAIALGAGLEGIPRLGPDEPRRRNEVARRRRYLLRRGRLRGSLASGILGRLVLKSAARALILIVTPDTTNTSEQVLDMK
jgi:hypothetical protein